MGIKKKIRCRNCKRLFAPDYRNRNRQKYCKNPECRKQAKADRIKLPAYFTAYGMRLSGFKRDPVPENLRALTATLIKNVARFADPLTILNGYASKSVNRLISPPLDNSQIKFRALQDLLDLFIANDLFNKDARNRLLFIVDPMSRLIFIKIKLPKVSDIFSGFKFFFLTKSFSKGPLLPDK
ncbi:hypothetical protein [Desulfobacterium sp. N47]|uniref:Uncharacterized protein n=2 Tax=uncultured Desulfobacterium sp. TaxID=201089 RepID=E1YBQ4_9BACT|nr:unknown protein [uncultured Desulfobacterium sp.]